MMAYIILEIAKNRLPMSAISEQLEQKVRHTTQLAPANGLYLAKIRY